MVFSYSYVRLPEGTPLEMGEAHFQKQTALND